MELIHRYCERDNSIRNYISLENWASKQEISGLLKSSTKPSRPRAITGAHVREWSMSLRHRASMACIFDECGRYFQAGGANRDRTGALLLAK